MSRIEATEVRTKSVKTLMPLQVKSKPAQSPRIKTAQAKAQQKQRDIASDDEKFEDFAFALTGKTADQRTPEENKALAKLRKEMLEGKIDPEFVEASPANGGGKDRLPVGVRGAFVPAKKDGQGRVIISGSLRGGQLQSAADEETGEAVANRAEQLGITVADGDAGARVAGVFNGQKISPSGNPTLFTDDRTDSAKVVSEGQVVVAETQQGPPAERSETLIDVQFNPQATDSAEVQYFDRQTGEWVTVASTRKDGRGRIQAVVPGNVKSADIRVVNESTGEKITADQGLVSGETIRFDDRSGGNYATDYNDVTVTTSAVPLERTTLDIKFKPDAKAHSVVQYKDDDGNWITVASKSDGDADGNVTVTVPDTVGPGDIRIVNVRDNVTSGGDENMDRVRVSTSPTTGDLTYRFEDKENDDSFDDVTVTARETTGTVSDAALYVQSLPTPEAKAAYIDDLPLVEAADVLAALPPAERSAIMAVMDPVELAEIIEYATPEQRLLLVQSLPTAQLQAEIIDQLPFAIAAEILAALPPAERNAIMAEMDPIELMEILTSPDVDPGVAAGIIEEMPTEMAAEFIARIAQPKPGETTSEAASRAAAILSFVEPGKALEILEMINGWQTGEATPQGRDLSFLPLITGTETGVNISVAGSILIEMARNSNPESASGKRNNSLEILGVALTKGTWAPSYEIYQAAPAGVSSAAAESVDTKEELDGVFGPADADMSNEEAVARMHAAETAAEAQFILDTLPERERAGVLSQFIAGGPRRLSTNTHGVTTVRQKAENLKHTKKVAGLLLSVPKAQRAAIIEAAVYHANPNQTKEQLKATVQATLAPAVALMNETEAGAMLSDMDPVVAMAIIEVIAQTDPKKAGRLLQMMSAPGTRFVSEAQLEGRDNLALSQSYIDQDGNVVQIWMPKTNQAATDATGAPIPVETKPVVSVNGQVVKPSQMYVGRSTADGADVVGFTYADPTTGEVRTSFVDTTSAAPAAGPDAIDALVALATEFSNAGNLVSLYDIGVDESHVAFDALVKFEGGRSTALVPTDDADRPPPPSTEGVEEDVAELQSDAGDELIEEGVMLDADAMVALGLITPEEADDTVTYFVPKSPELQSRMTALGMGDMNEDIVHTVPLSHQGRKPLAWDVEGGTVAVDGGYSGTTSMTSISIVGRADRFGPETRDPVTGRVGRSRLRVEFRPKFATAPIGVNTAGVGGGVDVAVTAGNGVNPIRAAAAISGQVKVAGTVRFSYTWRANIDGEEVEHQAVIDMEVDGAIGGELVLDVVKLLTEGEEGDRRSLDQVFSKDTRMKSVAKVTVKYQRLVQKTAGSAFPSWLRWVPHAAGLGGGPGFEVGQAGGFIYQYDTQSGTQSVTAFVEPFVVNILGSVESFGLRGAGIATFLTSGLYAGLLGVAGGFARAHGGPAIRNRAGLGDGYFANLISNTIVAALVGAGANGLNNLFNAAFPPRAAGQGGGDAQGAPGEDRVVELPARPVGEAASDDSGSYSVDVEASQGEVAVRTSSTAGGAGPSHAAQADDAPDGVGRYTATPILAEDADTGELTIVGTQMTDHGSNAGTSDDKHIFIPADRPAGQEPLADEDVLVDMNGNNLQVGSNGAGPSRDATVADLPSVPRDADTDSSDVSLPGMPATVVTREGEGWVQPTREGSVAIVTGNPEAVAGTVPGPQRIGSQADADEGSMVAEPGSPQDSPRAQDGGPPIPVVVGGEEGEEQGPLNRPLEGASTRTRTDARIMAFSVGNFFVRATFTPDNGTDTDTADPASEDTSADDLSFTEA